MDDFHERCFDAHRTYAEEQGLSAADWWRRFEDDDTDNVSDEKLDQLNFYGYYRCYPMRDQDVAVVGSNPLFEPSGPEHAAFEFSTYQRDFESIAEKSVSTMSNYFTDYTNHPRDIWLGATKNNVPRTKGVFRPLATETDVLDEEKYLQDEFYNDEFYDSIYYTNLVKFGSSPSFSDLPDQDRAVTLGAQYLREELDRVNPDLVIMLGKTLPKLADTSGITTVHGTHQKYQGYDVVPHIHPSGYRQNKSDGDYERYKKTIRSILN